MCHPSHPSTSDASQKNAAFTLTELLVVMVIVAILVAILLPVIGSVREKAAAVSCTSQLRQLGIAYAAYRQEHNGQGLPVASNPADPMSEGHNEYGFCYLRYYYRPGPRYMWTTANSYIAEPFEHCPSVKLNRLSVNTDPASSIQDYAIRIVSRGGTGVNYNVFFTNPTKTPLIWDGWIPNWGGAGTGRYSTVPLRHTNGINCAFLDGHVEFILGTDKRLYSGWWNFAVNNSKPDDTLLGTGTALGVTTVPP